MRVLNVLKGSVSCAVLAAAVTALSNVASAQGTDVETITVTGSRVISNGNDAPTPMTVVGAPEIENQGITSIVDISRALPQFRNQGGAKSGSNSSTNGGQGGLNLRNLGSNRNLVLLDGERIIPSTGDGTVDVNLIPSALIQRVDVVTGGASAVYGSDAVSGVVNFVLNNKYEGFKGTLSSGIAQQGDNAEYLAQLAGGASFLNDKLHIVGSFEFYSANGELGRNRTWYANRPGLANNPSYTATNGQYQNIPVAGNLVASYMSTGGLVNGCRTSTGANIANCSLKGTAFGPDGSPHAFIYGQYVNPTGTMLVPIGSTNPDYTNIYDGIKLTNPAQRTNLYLHASYDVSDSLEVYASVIEAKSKIGPAFTVPPYRLGTSATTWLSVTADNAYLPASIKAQMSGPGGGNAAGPYYLNVGRIDSDWGGNMKIQNTNTTARYVVGFKGELGDGWTLNGYYQYGRNVYYASITGNLLTASNGVTSQGAVNLATDAVVVTSANVGSSGLALGSVACRSTLTNPANGCQPLNIFGYGNSSATAIRYITADQFTRQVYSQNYAELSIQGEPLTLWAGPVAVAAGISYRSETINATSDAHSMANDFVVGNPQPYGGSYNVKEAFGEISAPIFEGLNVDFAARLTQYSTSGQVETWKAGATYNLPSFLSDAKLRFTRSRDIRAPSLTELYTGFAQARTTVVDPFATGNSQLSVSQYTGGNAALKPETADTISAGLVYEPSFVPGLSASVDYYNIKIKNAIGTLTSQDILNFCFQGQTALCNQIRRDGNGNLTAVYATNINIASQTTSGFDMELNYQTGIQDIFSDRDASLGFRVFANYVDRFLVFNGKTTSNQDSCLACLQPKWTVQALYTYATGPYRATVINRLIGGGQYNNIYDPQDPSYVPNAIQSNHVNPILYTDLNLAYDFSKWGLESEAFINIDNLFDRDPPFAFGLKYGPNASPLYDVVGRMYKVGIRFKM